MPKSGENKSLDLDQRRKQRLVKLSIILLGEESEDLGLKQVREDSACSERERAGNDDRDEPIEMIGQEVGHENAVGNVRCIRP